MLLIVQDKLTQKTTKINIKAIILITIIAINHDVFKSFKAETTKVKTDITTERIGMILLGRGLFILLSLIHI